MVTKNQLLRQYVDVISSIYSVPDDRTECGPVLFDLLDEENFRDGMHPNTAGHARILEALREFLPSPPRRD